MFTPVKTPELVKRMFPNLIWDLPSREKVIYLTFDDGPTPEITNWTLEVLKRYNAKATFFCIGKNIEAHPEIFQNIMNQGHAIGNHTYNHVKGWKTKTKDYLENVNKCQDIMNSHAQNSEFKIQNIFRPPYGQLRPKQAKALSALGYNLIMWSVLSIDWDNNVNMEQCLKNVIDNTKSGHVIVFHDSIKASRNMKYALPKMLEYFNEKGFVFKRIPELNQ
ncbi:MAG: polysaccharide deacetylase family protein [Flavobacteriaceae bacterium]|nr:polysaccharide deacetylase family protein [Flavobacteriaceae bacterium]